MKKILLAGESWTSVTTHVKGFDVFMTSKYEEGAAWLIDALTSGGYDVTYMPNHYVSEKFPHTKEEMKEYDAIILSDCGANTLLLSTQTFEKSTITTNRCEELKQYVLEGGGLCLIGGYLSFSGVDAKARYANTPIADVCPVDILNVDDREEAPQGIVPMLVDTAHPIFKDLPSQWPAFLGYNRTIANKSKGSVIATIGDDPFVAVGEYGKGRTTIFSSDCSPHWAPPAFCNWEYYNKFWINLFDWTTKNS